MVPSKHSSDNQKLQSTEIYYFCNFYLRAGCILFFFLIIAENKVFCLYRCGYTIEFALLPRDQVVSVYNRFRFNSQLLPPWNKRGIR